MDPLSAIGLASNIIGFVEFTSKLVSGAYEIYSSTARMTDEHADLTKVIEDVHVVTRRLGYSAAPAVTDDEAALIGLIEECRKLSEDLIRALQRLQTKNPRSKRESLHIAWRAMREKSNLESLEKRIDRYRREILDRIVIMMSEDTSSTYKLLQQNMETNQASASQSRKELQELREIVLSLAKKLKLDEVESQLEPKNSMEPVRTPGAGGAPLAEVRTMLSRVAQVVAAISKEDWILNRLSFGEMHSRELSIEDAHAKTFRWLLYDPSDEMPDEDAEDEDALKKNQNNETTGLEHGIDEPDRPELSPSPSRPETGSDLIESSWAPEAPNDGPSQQEAKEQDDEERKKTRLKFLSWLNSGTGVFHISGKLGSGKSTLMKFLSKEARTKQELQKWANSRRLLFSQFFFWASGSPLQRSLDGLYRGILWEMLRECPDLMRDVFPHCWDADFDPAKDRLQDGPFPTSELVAAFELLIRSKTVFNKHKVCFFIDGLDEFDGDHWKLARLLKVWSDVGELKICVSSRPHNEFIRTFVDPSKHLSLHELTRQDIEKFVDDELEHDERFPTVFAQDKRCERLVNRLTTKADGVFLWVRLAMRELLSGIGNNYSFSQLEEELDQLPEDLETLFRKLLASMRKSDRARAARVFLIMTSNFVFRGMHRLVILHAVIDELSDAHYDTALLYSAELGPPVTSEDFERMTHTMQDRLNSRCKGLVQFSKPPVFRRLPLLDFIHGSIEDFLALRDVRADLLQVAGPSFNPAKSMCMAFLRLLKGSCRLAENKSEPEEDSYLFGEWDREVSFGSYFWLLEKLAMPILVMTSQTQTETEASCPCPSELEVASELLLKLSACLPATPAPTASVLVSMVGYGLAPIHFMSESNNIEAQEKAWLALCALYGARRFVLDRISQLPELLSPSAKVDLLLLASVGDDPRCLDVKQTLETTLLTQGVSPNWPLRDPFRYIPVIPSFPRFSEERPTTWTMFLRLVGTLTQAVDSSVVSSYTKPVAEVTCKTIGKYLEFGADPTVVFVGYQIILPETEPDNGSPDKSSEILIGPTYFDLGQFIEVWDPPSKQDLLALWDRKRQPPHRLWNRGLNFTRSFWQSKPVSGIQQIDTESLRSSIFLAATVVTANDLPSVNISDAERWSRTTEGRQWLLQTKSVIHTEIWSIRI
ncbi:MAG: hypothetical protein M1821_010036 [Bathelium mastoideum]|nr:MAG: hypothetical protein M1821_010036 [Bathelium mastoideum]